MGLEKNEKADELASRSTCWARTLGDMLFKGEIRKDLELKRSQFWKETRELRQAKKLLGDFDYNYRSQVCRKLCKISYGTKYQHKIGVVGNAFCDSAGLNREILYTCR